MKEGRVKQTGLVEKDEKGFIHHQGRKGKKGEHKRTQRR
jgi:hypothetical protein